VIAAVKLPDPLGFSDAISLSYLAGEQRESSSPWR